MEEKGISSGGSDQEQEPSWNTSRRRSSRESRYGAFLLSGFVVAILALVGSIGWWAYRNVYLPTQREQASISSLVQEASQPEKSPDSEKTSSPEERTEAPKEEVSDIREETVSVLNGGGAKGSAGEAAALLKKEGYGKVSLGNTEKDYVGVTVYFASGKESVADGVKKLLLKRYPKAVSREAVEGNGETSGASVVVIIGK